MKRILIVGLCVVAAFALSATTASSASAGEYGQCEAHKKGNYTESNCLTFSEKKGKPVEHKGKFEWVPGPSPSCVAQKKGEFTDSACLTQSAKPHKGSFEREGCFPNCAVYTGSTGRAELHTAALGAEGVECTASTGAGEITGAKTDLDLVTFTNCSTLGEKCTSEGQPEGTIQAFPLETMLIDHGEQGPSGDEPKAGEVWTEFVGEPEYGGYSAIFGCTGVGYFATKGSLSGITTPVSVMSLTSSTAFAGLAGEGGPGIGEQDLATEYNTEPVFPSGIGPFPSSEEVENAATVNCGVSEIKGDPGGAPGQPDHSTPTRTGGRALDPPGGACAALDVIAITLGGSPGVVVKPKECEFTAANQKCSIEVRNTGGAGAPNLEVANNADKPEALFGAGKASFEVELIPTNCGKGKPLPAPGGKCVAVIKSLAARGGAVATYQVVVVNPADGQGALVEIKLKD